MTVPCKVSTAEMREGYRLNFSPFFWKIFRGNLRILVYLVAFTALIVYEISNGLEWSTVALMIAVLALFLALFLFRVHRAIVKSARVISASCTSFTIDSNGIVTEMTNGTRTSVPWSAINRWREGKLVFTIGDANAFRTISKSAIGEMQCGELRSLLVSQVR